MEQIFLIFSDFDERVDARRSPSERWQGKYFTLPPLPQEGLKKACYKNSQSTPLSLTRQQAAKFDYSPL
ncbi:MAG: hypothetical protein QM523_11500, partial [Candidatus Pacebacteria bacterium]|nr:hypothetical protein [Candidatus Paceibacterota bacterium]